ncbi:hypothetical protein ACEQPO_26350 [Bacillus sp. SL00103]
MSFTDADKERALAVVKQVSDTFLKQDKALFTKADGLLKVIRRTSRRIGQQ